jgi:lysophospholipase L1-like esterase
MAFRSLYIALSLIVLASLPGCSTSTNNSGSNGPGPTPLPPAAAVSYSAIAASDGAGAGSSVPCAPFTPCTDGKGYVPVVARQLRAEGHAVTLLNMGIPGAVLSPGTQQLGNTYGLGIAANFIQDEGQFVLKESTLVTIFAGANDANTIATAIERGATTNENATNFINDRIQQFADDYRTLVSTVRGRAPNARIVILNLPNLAGLPYTAGRTPTERRWIQQLSVGFTRQAANTFASQGAIVIDLMCDARSYQPSIYSADGFHPNDAGYQFMADEILQAVHAGSSPAPIDSCAQMTIAQ